VVHPEGDRLVAARTLEARSRRVRRFLAEHGATLKGVARREASKYL